jgi:uncharacterized membrane protein YeaQ/YmgE (transglycosylase-associated protein family)
LLGVRGTTGILSEDRTMVVNILVWCVFGLLAGLVARFIGSEGERSDPTGIALTIILGIAGAVVGGYLSSLLFNWDINSFSVAGFAVAVGGALLLLFLYHMVRSMRKSI